MLGLVIWQESLNVVGIAAVKPDDRFRFMLMVSLLVLFGIGVFHRLRARTGERLDRKREGLFILVALRLTALGGMIALAAYLLNPAKLAIQCCAATGLAEVG